MKINKPVSQKKMSRLIKIQKTAVFYLEKKKKKKNASIFFLFAIFFPPLHCFLTDAPKSSLAAGTKAQKKGPEETLRDLPVEENV